MMTVLPMPGAMTPVSRILSTFNRDQIAGFIEVAIGLLDLADGDNDAELNGDEADGINSEDDFWPHSSNVHGPGCPVSDPGEPVGDEADGNFAEDDFATHRGAGPGCPVSDPGGGDESASDVRPIVDPLALSEHRDRIRRTRCFRVYRQYRDWGTGRIGREPRGWSLYRDAPAPGRRSLLRRKRGMPRFPRP